MSILVEEIFGGQGGGERTAVWKTGQVSGAPTLQSITIFREAKQTGSAWRSLQSAFLPEGYPNSVTKDYIQFQFWDTLQGLSSYIRGMLSTQAVLGALGVGGTTGTALGATFTWFVRDLTGMLVGIMFAHIQGSKLDVSAKQWRLAADFMNDIGMLMDLVSPLFPNVFLLLLCLGSISRAITGTASGATRAALTQHFALRQNAADISAKEGSQETMATLVGMMAGMVLAKVTTDRPFAIWSSFLTLMFFHMYANYRAMRCLCLTSLNPERTTILLQAFLTQHRVLSPQEVPSLERILPLPSLPRWLPFLSYRRPLHESVKLGARLSSLALPNGWRDLQTITSRYQGEKYLLIDIRGEVHVVLHRDATPGDVIRAYVHALFLVNELQTAGAAGSTGSDAAQLQAFDWMHHHFPRFQKQLEVGGWRGDRVLLPSTDWRADWTISTE